MNQIAKHLGPGWAAAETANGQDIARRDGIRVWTSPHPASGYCASANGTAVHGRTIDEALEKLHAKLKANVASLADGVATLAAVMPTRQWHSGPPPHVGWWQASVRRRPSSWRWWDGTGWSLSAEHTCSASQAGHLARDPNPSGPVQWTHYYPLDARVPRVAP